MGSAALALAGCAATGVRPAASRAPACLPPIRASMDRVIRTVAGLRPFRAAGFRTDAERVGDSLVVHNYGHGGGGITLAWGSSRIAVDTALREGGGGPVAVLGAGIMGLTAARLVQEAGYPVTLYAAALPPETTSNIAGGQFYPSGVVERVGADPAFDARLKAAVHYSYRRYQLHAGEEYGVRWMTNYVASSSDWRPDAMDRLLEGTLPDSRMLGRDEHPFPFDPVRQYGGMIVDPQRFLRALERDVRIAGGQIRIRRFATPADIAALPERTVVNCTGLGSAALFSDTGMIPVRGQLAVLIPQPGLDYALFPPGGLYMFSRADGVILGGSFERGVADPTPQPERIARIVNGFARLSAGWRC